MNIVTHPDGTRTLMIPMPAPRSLDKLGVKDWIEKNYGREIAWGPRDQAQKYLDILERKQAFEKAEHDAYMCRTSGILWRGVNNDFERKETGQLAEHEAFMHRVDPHYSNPATEWKRKNDALMEKWQTETLEMLSNNNSQQQPKRIAANATPSNATPANATPANAKVQQPQVYEIKCRGKEITFQFCSGTCCDAHGKINVKPDADLNAGNITFHYDRGWKIAGGKDAHLRFFVAGKYQCFGEEMYTMCLSLLDLHGDTCGVILGRNHDGFATISTNFEWTQWCTDKCGHLSTADIDKYKNLAWRGERLFQWQPATRHMRPVDSRH